MRGREGKEQKTAASCGLTVEEGETDRECECEGKDVPDTPSKHKQVPGLHIPHLLASLDTAGTCSPHRETRFHPALRGSLSSQSPEFRQAKG